MELVVALGVVLVAMIPLLVTMVREQRQAKALYCRAAAIQIVDGELEVLAAGAHVGIEEGVRDFVPSALSVTNLPAGRFVLSKSPDTLTLEWLPSKRSQGGAVRRSVRR